MKSLLVVFKNVLLIRLRYVALHLRKSAGDMKFTFTANCMKLISFVGGVQYYCDNGWTYLVVCVLDMIRY